MDYTQIKIIHPGGANMAFRRMVATFTTAAATTYRTAITRRSSAGVETTTNYDFTDDGTPTEAEVRTGIVASLAASTDVVVTGSGATIIYTPTAANATDGQGGTYSLVPIVKIVVSVTAGAGTFAATEQAVIVSGILAGYDACHLLGYNDARRKHLAITNTHKSKDVIVNEGDVATAANGVPVWPESAYDFVDMVQPVNIYCANAVTVMARIGK